MRRIPTTLFLRRETIWNRECPPIREGRLVRRKWQCVGTTKRPNDHNQSHDDIVETVHSIGFTGISNWDDRLQLQTMWSNRAKGWRVAVEWKHTDFGVGLFAAQDIPVNTVLRRGVWRRNLIQFTCLEDIESFCQLKCNSSDAADNNNNHISADQLSVSRLNYVKDYLWGFDRSANERGYASSENQPHWVYAMWVPGNGLNHKLEPNTVYKATPWGIDLVSMSKIEQGQELYDDYRRHGLAPEWLRSFAKKYNVTLNFADCNDFVKDDVSINQTTT